MDRIAEAHHIAQKIRPMAETLQDSGNPLTSRLRAPLVIDARDLSSSLSIVDQVDLRLGFFHRIHVYDKVAGKYIT